MRETLVCVNFDCDEDELKKIIEKRELPISVFENKVYIASTDCCGNIQWYEMGAIKQLEEKKIPEKLNYFKSEEQLYNMSKLILFNNIVEKINEICDYLKSKGE